jgi:hypothetical protein
MVLPPYDQGDASEEDTPPQNRARANHARNRHITARGGKRNVVYSIRIQMMPPRPPIDRRERHELRREEDRDTVEYVESTIAWVRKGPRILVGITAFLAGIAATGSWFGARASSPGQRITRLEARTDSAFRALDTKIGLTAAAHEEMEQKSLTRDEKIDLLLRMGCPNIRRADLIVACREQGAMR